MDYEEQSPEVDDTVDEAAAFADALIAKTEARFIQQVRDDYALAQEALRTKHNKFITYLKRYYNVS